MFLSVQFPIPYWHTHLLWCYDFTVYPPSPAHICTYTNTHTCIGLPDAILSVVPWDVHPISGRCVLCGHVLSCWAFQDTQTRSRVSCHANSYILGWVCRSCCNLFSQWTPFNEQYILGYSCILSWGANWYVVVCPKLVTLRWRWNYGRIFFWWLFLYLSTIFCQYYANT